MSNWDGTLGFPFFRLPPEIRNDIYYYLFASPHVWYGEHVFIPDVDHCRKTNNVDMFPAKMSDTLPFLRACQQAHEEATAILYGENKFVFSDKRLGQETYTIPNFNIELQRCDFMTLYYFLNVIGEQNRSKLRYLQPAFLTRDFTTYPHEVTASRAQFYIKEGGGAGFVGDALDLLSQRHNLVQLELSFVDSGQPSVYNPEEQEAPNSFIDLCSGDRALVKRFQQVRGIEEFSIVTKDDLGFATQYEGDDGLWYPLYPIFDETKQIMEGVDADKLYEMEWEKWWGTIIEDEELESNPSFIALGRNEIMHATKYGFCNQPADQLYGSKT